MTAATLLHDLAGAGIEVRMGDPGKIKVTGDQAAIDCWLPEIVAHKPALLALLSPANDPAPALRYATDAQLADDRRTCQQCRELAYNGKCQCAERGELPMAAPWYEPISDALERCVGYRSGADDVDQRPGRERWPGLARRLDAGLTMPVRSNKGGRGR